MALPTIQAPEDFKGRLKISADTFVVIELNEMIQQEYPKMVREILGDAAYAEIRDAVTLPDKWADTMNGVAWLDSRGLLNISQGLTQICKQWLYFYWMRESPIINTNTGNVSNFNENSRATSRGDVAAISCDRYNEGVDLLQDELYPFLLYFESVSRAVSAAANLGGSTWQLTLPDTLYLADGDAIKVDGVEYAAANVSATTVEIESTASAFSVAVWYPFENLPFPRKERVFS